MTSEAAGNTNSGLQGECPDHYGRHGKLVIDYGMYCERVRANGMNNLDFYETSVGEDYLLSRVIQRNTANLCPLYTEYLMGNISRDGMVEESAYSSSFSGGAEILFSPLCHGTARAGYSIRNEVANFSVFLSGYCEACDESELQVICDVLKPSAVEQGRHPRPET
jgi:hypothetical protein